MGQVGLDKFVNLKSRTKPKNFITQAILPTTGWVGSCWFCLVCCTPLVEDIIRTCNWITLHICTVTIAFYMIILYFFSLLSLALSDSLSPTLQCQEEADCQHPSTITTNQPPPPPQPTHYNINIIQTQSTQN